MALPSGWHLVGYPLQQQKSPNAALSLVANQLTDGDLLKTDHTVAVYNTSQGGWVGMATMQPNAAYRLYLGQAAAIQYNNARTGNQAFNHHQFEHNMTFTATVAPAAGLVLDGSRIVAMAGNQVRGIGQLRYHAPTQQYLTTLFVYANAAGEALHFKVVTATGAEYQASNSITFSSNAHHGAIPSPYVFNTEAIAATEPAVALWPNPATTHCQVQYTAAASGQGHWVLRNQAGHVVSQGTVTAQQGSNALQLPVHQLPKGMYLLQLTVNNQAYQTEKLLKH